MESLKKLGMPAIAASAEDDQDTEVSDPPEPKPGNPN
jgi:hypothetical protein